MTIEEELKTSNFENEQVKANLNILVTASFLHNKMSEEERMNWIKGFRIAEKLRKENEDEDEIR